MAIIILPRKHHHGSAVQSNSVRIIMMVCRHYCRAYVSNMSENAVEHGISILYRIARYLALA